MHALNAMRMQIRATDVHTELKTSRMQGYSGTHKDSQEAQQGSQTVISTLGCTPEAQGAQGFVFGEQPADFACPLFSSCNLHKFFMCPSPFVSACVCQS